MLFSLRLPAEPISVAVARGALHAILCDADAERRQAAELVLSEVVTNAIRHGSPSRDDQVDVEISVEAGRLVALVRDCGPPFDPLPGRPSPHQTGGFGLHIARSTSDLSVHHTGAGNVVTFAVAVRGSPAAPAAAPQR